MLFLSGAALLIVYLVVDPTQVLRLSRHNQGPMVGVWVQLVTLVLLGVVSATVPATWLARPGVWPAISVLGVLSVCNFSLLFPSQAVMGHVLLAFPVVFAAAQLSAPVAAGITGFAVLADAVTLAMVEAPAAAAIHWLYLAPVLVLVTVVLTHGMNRQDQLVAALHEQAAIDPLTGLLTRRGLDETLQRVLFTTPHPEGAALILVDLDGFKAVNDSYGHPLGDDALVHLAQIVTSQVRSDDAVVSRLGGDELAVVLPGCTAEVAARRAEQLVDAVRAAPLALPDGTLLALSISVGVAHAPRHATEPRGLYSAADAALYQAKQGGRNRAAVATAPA